MYKDLVSQHLSDADKAFYLREAVQERLQLDWTITDDEATELLHTYPAGVLLQTLRMVKRHINERQKELVYYDQNQIVEIIRFLAEVQQNIIHGNKDICLEEPKFMREIPKYSERS